MKDAIKQNQTKAVTPKPKASLDKDKSKNKQTVSLIAPEVNTRHAISIPAQSSTHVIL